jgi:hypothetical protein
VTIFAIIVAAIPPSDQSPLWFEAKVLGGVGLFYFVGWLFYRRGKHS